MKNTLVIVGVLIIAAAGIYMFTQRDAAQLMLDDGAELSESLLSETAVFMTRRAILESIELDFSVLQDRRLLTLQSYSEPVEERPVGRENPFDTAVNPQ